MNYKKLNFLKLYRILFFSNFILFFALFTVTMIFPQSFAVFSRTLPVCDLQKDFIHSLMEYWSFSILPMCVIFVLGLTFYIPALSPVISAFNGIYLALDIYTYFGTHGIFYAGTMSFISLCISWIYLWYTAYTSCNSIRLFISDIPFLKSISASFVGKYIVWFALFSAMVFIMNIAQCIMYRI